MLDVTRVRGQFNLVNAYNLSPTEKIELQSKYGVNRHFFKFINDPSQIPRFVEGDRKDQTLFIIDIPCQHKLATTSIPAAIDDNHNITIFTNEETKYIIPIVTKLLNEKANDHYGCPDVLLDTCESLSNIFLNRIRDIDNQRINDKKLLQDKSKHRNTNYIDHLSNLRAIASAYVDSLASNYSALYSIKKILGPSLSDKQLKVLDADLIEFKQAKDEAIYCFRRCRAVLRSFHLRVDMSTNRKMKLITIFSFLVIPISIVYGFYGANIGAAANGLPFAQSWWSISLVALAVTSIFDSLSLWFLKH